MEPVQGLSPDPAEPRAAGTGHEPRGAGSISSQCLLETERMTFRAGLDAEGGWEGLQDNQVRRPCRWKVVSESGRGGRRAAVCGGKLGSCSDKPSDACIRVSGSSGLWR